MSQINKKSHDAWLATISENYGRELSSPFELNMMEAKIRKSIHAPKNKKNKLAPAFAVLFSMVLVLGLTMFSAPSEDFPASTTRYVHVDEPAIRLFSTADFDSTEDNFLPDDYITISQVMFD